MGQRAPRLCVPGPKPDAWGATFQARAAARACSSTAAPRAQVGEDSLSSAMTRGLKEVRCHGRHAHKIFIIIESLYAVGAEGYKDLASLTDPGERAEVEVVVLRRCKAQLDEQFLSKVLGRQVGKALVDVHVSKLDVALKEHSNDREAQ